MAIERVIGEKSLARITVASCIALAVVLVYSPFRTQAQSVPQSVLAAKWDANEPQPSVRRLPASAPATTGVVLASAETVAGQNASASRGEGSVTVAAIAALPQQAPVGAATAAPGVSFKKPEPRDRFSWAPNSPSANVLIHSLPGQQQMTSTGAAAGNLSTSGGPSSSAFRVVGVDGAAPQSMLPQTPVDRTVEQQSTVPATFMPTPVDSQLSDATAASPVAVGTYEATVAQPTAADSRLPAPPAALTDSLPGALPMPGNIASASVIGQNASSRAFSGACPYSPGDSGTPSVCGVECGGPGAARCATWDNSRCIPWALFGPGEYVGPARPEHLSTYYLRVNDLVSLTYITSRRKEAERYRIGCGDRLQIEWLQAPSTTDPKLDREVVVQPDGTVTLPLVGDVIAVDKTVKELREEIIKAYGRYQRDPQITVTPMEVNTAIQDILDAVTSVSGSNGQTQALRVTPEGTIQAPGLGSVLVQGLTIEEARAEIEARYAAKFGPGLLVSPSLTERAASFVFVGGEVQAPGRYALEGPTTIMQAIALAGGWNNGGNLRQVVVFRRDENWCLKATKIDVRAPLYGQDPCPTNDVWLRDNDLVIVPKTKILCATDVINLYFTRGVYAAFPISYVYSFTSGSSVTPISTTVVGP